LANLSHQMAELVQLEVGSTVDKIWHVESKIGEGNCTVYKCTNKQNGQDGPYALKVESLNEKFAFLRKEVIVLCELSTQKKDHHFCKVKTRARMDNYFYVVMTLVGRTIHDLRMESPDQKFTLGTAISVGTQCLKALEDLHSIEYVYRELTPTNFAVGLAGIGEARKIYLLDLGTARKFISEDGSMKKQRSLMKFRTNTIKYAPLAYHENRELCRKDDIESWLYMTTEFIRESLPWKHLTDPVEVGNMKKSARKGEIQRKLFKYCPKFFVLILDLADECKFFDAPDYPSIYDYLKQTLDETNAKEYPYDWEIRHQVAAEVDDRTGIMGLPCPTSSKKESASYKVVIKPPADKSNAKSCSTFKLADEKESAEKQSTSKKSVNLLEGKESTSKCSKTKPADDNERISAKFLDKSDPSVKRSKHVEDKDKGSNAKRSKTKPVEGSSKLLNNKDKDSTSKKSNKKLADDKDSTVKKLQKKPGNDKDSKSSKAKLKEDKRKDEKILDDKDSSSKHSKQPRIKSSKANRSNATRNKPSKNQVEAK